MPKPSNPRFRIACRMLRLAGKLDKVLPGQRAGESTIDWLCRLGLARDPQTAAEMLLYGSGGQGALNALDEVVAAQEQDPAPQRLPATP